MNSDNDQLQQSQASSLAQLLSVDDSTEQWQPSDLAAIFEHQLQTPLAMDLGKRNERVVEIATSEAKPPIHTFYDLLTHRAPPLELLQAVKRFAKERGQSGDALPREISAALYLAAISAALISHNQKISDSENASLLEKLRWARELIWLDPKTRALFDQALDLLNT